MNSLEKLEHYEVYSRCSNCGNLEKTVIPKGKTFAEFAVIAECPRCGCRNTLVKQ